MPSLSARHLRICGQVQGVGFRYHTRSTARNFGLTGWVKNLPDGSVEIHAEGSPEELDRLQAWCQSGGPPAARVTEIQANPTPPRGCYHAFTIEV